MIVLAEIMALNRTTGIRVPLYVSSSQNPTANGLNGKVWNPNILGEVELSERAFNGGFAEAVEVPTASLEINTFGLKASDGTPASALGFNGATVNIYAGIDGQTWPWTLVFMGRVLGSTAGGFKRSLSISVNDAPLKKSVLTLKYGGTGGLDGDAGLAGVDKPWLFTGQNVQPVLINALNNVYQFSAYGPILQVINLYERASDFGASTGNFANYAALVAAAIPASGWATCTAEGLIRLGAPEAGVITGDVEGDFFGGTLRTRPGQILQRIAAHLGVTASLNTTSLDAFDTFQSTRPAGGRIDVVINAQLTLLDLAQKLAREGLGQAMLQRQDGKLRICRPAIGSALFTLDASKGVQIGTPSWDSSELAASPPYSKIQMSGVTSWRVHSAEEVASADLEVDFATQVTGAEKPANNATRNANRGAWSSAGIAYVVGDEVTNGGSSWVSLTVHTSTAGNGPPTLPATSNTNWQLRAAQGTEGTPGLDAVTLVVNPGSIVIPCDQFGAPKILPVARNVSLMALRAGVQIAATDFGFISQSGCTVSVIATDTLQVSAIVADAASFSFFYTAGGTRNVETVLVTKLNDPSTSDTFKASGSVSGTGSWVTVASIQVTTYPSGILRVSGDIEYNIAGTSGTATASSKLIIRPLGGSSTDITSSVGTAASYRAAIPGEPAEYLAGFAVLPSGAPGYVDVSVAGSAQYVVELQTFKSAGTASINGATSFSSLTVERR
jgi:hypothetical protein